MLDWNVVATVSTRQYHQAVGLLRGFGPVHKTDFFNVLVLQVADGLQFLDELYALARDQPHSLDCLSRVLPVTTTFVFQTPEQFETLARQAVMDWIPQLESKRFHVRMHRRGFKGKLSSQEEERFLDHFLVEQTGGTAQVSFDAPDFIIAVETVGQHAGLSLWTYDQIKRYPLVKLD